MSDFRYIARTEAGEKVAGVLEADNASVAFRLLDERSLYPVEIVPQRERRDSARGGRVRARDLGILYGQLADLSESGVPLLRSLDSLVQASVHKNLRELVQKIRSAVADGRSLTDSMREHPDVFPLLHVAMVEAGERANFLEAVLRGLAGFIERYDELQSTVRGALVYPALLTVVGSSIMIAALVFFVPRFEPLLEGVEQPLPTVILFELSALVRYHWLPVLLLAAASLAGAIAAVRSEKGRELFEIWRLKLPVVGSALRMVAITRFSRILGTMLANGVPMLQALSIAKDSTGSRLIADSIENAVESVRAGRTLTEPLGASGLFPPQVLAMIAVAEESNQLQKVLIQIADTIERRTHCQVDQAVRLLEPVVLCVVAGAIGFLALGLLLPIFSLAGSLGAK